jgi:hypothetical protein
MEFTGRRLPSKDRALVEAIYGPHAVYQIAQADEGCVVYCVTPDQDGIVRLAQAARGEIPAFSSMPPVNDILRRLPERPHVVALADIRNFSRFAPRMAELERIGAGLSHRRSRTSPAGSVPPLAEPSGQESFGPLVAWAMVVAPTSLRGEAYMSRSDIARSVPLLQQMAQEISKVNEGREKRSGLKIQIERRRSENKKAHP